MQPTRLFAKDLPDIIASDVLQFEESRNALFSRYSHRKQPHDIVKLVLEFTSVGVENRELKCLWLGVCPVRGFLCYSQETLSRRLSLKKSSIDSLFSKRGYQSTRSRKQFLPLLHQALPLLTEDRKWTARKVPETGSGEDEIPEMPDLNGSYWDVHYLMNAPRAGFSRDFVETDCSDPRQGEPTPIDVFLAFFT
jgi:hypothetical protein